MEFQCYEGSPTSDLVVFLPWNMSLIRAKQMRLLPKHYRVCYVLPPAVVSSVPQHTLDAGAILANDFSKRFSRDLDDGAILRIIGLSVGNFPATLIANQHGLPLLSVASGHSGAWLLWNSPSATFLKEQAEKLGFKESDFQNALENTSPPCQLDNLSSNSLFIVGVYDRYVPRLSSKILEKSLKRENLNIKFVKLPFGHALTLISYKIFANFYGWKL